MANLTESAIFEAGIYQLETTDPVLGGASGIANTQAKQLANRTTWIKEKLDLLGFGTTGVPQYTGNLNALTTSGWWYATTATTNKPTGASEGFFNVVQYAALGYSFQAFHDITADRSWTRRILDGPVFSPWSEIARVSTVTSLNDQLIGSVAAFAANTAPTGWFKANGAAVSRSLYAALFARIGTTFGAGNGSTTFNLPDLRGEFVRGWDDGRGVDTGRAFGSAQSASVDSSGVQLREAANNYLPGGNVTGDALAYFGNADVATYGTAATYFGGTETRPRNVALLYCIKWQ
jgi:microcystin-dependent protein